MIAKLIGAMFTLRYPRRYTGRHRARPAPERSATWTARATRARDHGTTAL
jgi:hypothetical protein